LAKNINFLSEILANKNYFLISLFRSVFMPIIKAKEKMTKEQMRISIEKNIIDEIKQYCEWAGVQKIDDFVEQAAQYILSKDKDWQIHMNQKQSIIS